MIALLTLLVQFQAHAVDHIYSKSNPTEIERTANTSKKIKLSLPVQFQHNKCVESTQVPVTRYRPIYVPCGGYYGYRGRYGYGGYYGWASCYAGQQAYTEYVTECTRTELVPSTQVREVVLKFKKGTQLKGNDAERIEVSVNQRQVDSDALTISVNQITTNQVYDVRSNGRRVVFRGRK